MSKNMECVMEEELDLIMVLLQKYWDKYNRGKGVVWFRNEDTGQLVIYTRGEYSKDLIAFITGLK